MRNIFNKSFRVDMQLVLILLMFAFFSSFVIFSASKENVNMLISHEVKILVSFVVFIIVSNISPIYIKSWVPRLYVFFIFLYILTALFGETNMGAKRWLNLYFFNIQVSEFMKIILPLFVAWYLSKFSLADNIKSLILLSIFIAIPVALTIIQPDLGTSLLILGAGVIALFLGGLSYKVITFTMLIIISCSPILWMGLKDYQKERVLSFMDPERDPLGSGYHVIQSKIAIGNGGLSGTGWGEGTQIHFGFIPEMHTDFIFAVIGEEFGLLGFLILMFMYLLLVYKLYKMGNYMKNIMYRVFTFTFIFIFVSYIFINILMVIGMLPVVGVPLPLISFGGSYMMAIFLGLGIISSFYNYESSLPFRERN